MNSPNTFRSILVGDDGSPDSRAAVESAFALAECMQAKVLLLGVLEPPPAEEQAEGYGLEETMREHVRLQASIEQDAEMGRARGLEVVVDVLRGSVKKEMKRFVDEHTVDLLVVGHRHLSRPRRWLEGSTSEDLAHALDVSILIVHGNRG